MSVILQSFLHNPLLRNFYLSDGHQTADCQKTNCLSCGMDDLFQEFYAQDKVDAFAASNLLSCSWSARQGAFADLAGYDEQDAHEYFQFLVEELHQANKENGQPCTDRKVTLHEDGLWPCNCIIHQTFHGKLQSTVTCEQCQSMTTSVEPFLDLSLGLDHAPRKRTLPNGKTVTMPLTLQRCLKAEYMRSERCEYSCQNCGSGPQKARKQLSIKRLPNVLCFQFKVGAIYFSR